MLGPTKLVVRHNRNLESCTCLKNNTYPHRGPCQTLLDKYLHRGCNICNKRTPNEPGGFYNFEEKKITLIKEKATRYVGQDDNTTGNMLYLCPNHAHSYSKKCVKIVLQLEDGTWKEISDIKEKIDSKKFSYSDLRVEVWEGKSSDDIDWDEDEDDSYARIPEGNS